VLVNIVLLVLLLSDKRRGKICMPAPLAFVVFTIVAVTANCAMIGQSGGNYLDRFPVDPGQYLVSALRFKESRADGVNRQCAQ